MKSFSMLLAAVCVMGISCERHEFEGPQGTKQLHQHHSTAGDHKDEGKHPSESAH